MNNNCFQFSTNPDLNTILKSLANHNTAPGAAAACGLLGAIAARIAIAGTTEKEAINSLLQLSEQAIKAGDLDISAYWLNDKKSQTDWITKTPNAIQSLVGEIYDTCRYMTCENQVDINVAKLLALTASTATDLISKENTKQYEEKRLPQNTLLAGSLSSQKGIINIEKASRCYLYDEDGKDWFDATSGMWNVPLGHGHRSPISGFIAQSLKVSAINPFITSSTVVSEAANKVATILDRPNDKVFFCSSGSESIEVALRIGLACTSPQSKVWSLPNSFHGSTAGAASLSGFETIWGPLPKTKRIGSPTSPKNWRAPGIGFVEALSAANDMRKWPKAWYTELQRFQREGGIIIADEVATGLGRASWPSAFHQSSISPDITVLGKGLANGITAISCVVISERIFSRLNKIASLDFGHTHSNHPAAASATIKCLESLNELDYDHASTMFKNTLLQLNKPINGNGFMYSISGRQSVCRQQIIEAMKEARIVFHMPTVLEEVSSIIVAPPLNISHLELVDMKNRLTIFMRKIAW